jgi:hypothetical protein
LSAYRGEPEMPSELPNGAFWQDMPTGHDDVRFRARRKTWYTGQMTRMMWWTTPAPDIECVKG